MIIDNKKINLKKEDYNILYNIFNNYCPKAEIWAYGSRITENSHSGSDLDLIVKKFNDKNKNIIELKQLLIDSNIPFLIDIYEYDSLYNSFKEEINKNYVVLFNNKNN